MNTNKYYLTHILNVLSDVVSWKDLTNIKSIKSNNTYHYSPYGAYTSPGGLQNN